MRIVAVLFVLFFPAVAGHADPPAPDPVRVALDRAIDGAAALQTHGGWGCKYSEDRAVMWGEWRPVPKGWITVQPPATPTTAMTMLRAARLLDHDAARASADNARRALLAIQTAEGGFPHEAPPGNGPTKQATFDDDTTTSALRFLVAWWEFTGDEADRANVEKVGDFILQSQYGQCGLWPQRYPPPSSGYAKDITFNDNVVTNVLRALFLLEDTLGDARYTDAIHRAGQCILRLQGGEGEAIWGQQYDPETLTPSWARKFEPPGYASAESAGVCGLLLDLYARTEDEAYLASLRRALHWYDTHQLEGGLWARLYEPGTQRPVYGRRDKAEKVYDRAKATGGYGWEGNYYPRAAAKDLEIVEQGGHAALIAARKERNQKAVPQADPDQVARLISTQRADGLWSRKPSGEERDLLKKAEATPDQDILHVGDWNRNVNLLLDVLEAQQEGRP